MIHRDPKLSASRSYRLIEAVGKGGFGTVYRGQALGDAGFVKTVAVKLLNEDAGEDFAQRLRDEARVLALLRHRAVVHVDDLVLMDGRWAVVMEYVEGADLKEVIRLGPMPLRPACEVVREVASALHSAHTAMDAESQVPIGIIHRDIKPANIRLTPVGEVKLLDFGVARARLHDREAETRSMTFGSSGYLAPERHDGIDSPAADVFSLGVVLYEVVAGMHVGRLSVSESRHERIVDSAIFRIADRPEPLLALLRRMLSYDPEARPDAGVVARELWDLLVAADGPWLLDWAPDAVTRAMAAAPRLDLPPPPSSPRPGAEDDPDEAEDDPTEEVTREEAGLPPGADAPSPSEEPPEAGAAENASPAEPDPSEAEGAAHLDAPLEADVGEPPLEPAAAHLDAPLDADVGEPPPEPRGRRRSLLMVALLVVVGAVGAVGWLRGGHLDPAGRDPASLGLPVGPVRPPPLDPMAALGPEDDAPEPAAGAGAAAGSSAAGGSSAEVRSVEPPSPPRRPAPDQGAAISPSSGEARPTTSAQQGGQEPGAPPAKEGRVEILGEVASAMLLDEGGASHPRGSVPEGTYSLSVTFPNGVSIRRDGMVRVKAGETARVRCDQIVESCRLER